MNVKKMHDDVSSHYYGSQSVQHIHNTQYKIKIHHHRIRVVPSAVFMCECIHSTYIHQIHTHVTCVLCIAY